MLAPESLTKTPVAEVQPEPATAKATGLIRSNTEPRRGSRFASVPATGSALLTVAPLVFLRISLPPTTQKEKR
ncbi:hypothetical protein GCM10009642_39720 [Nocardiopsis metallicus]